MLRKTNAEKIRRFAPKAYVGAAARFVWTLIFLFGALIIFNLPAEAQSTVTGGFVGRVTEKGAGTPIEGAIVTFTNQANNSQTARQTDSDGNFIRTTLPPGDYKIRVTKDGYEDYEGFQTLFATQSNSVIPLPIQLVKKDTQVALNPTPTPTSTPTQPTQPNNARDLENREGIESANLNPQRGGAFSERAVRTLPLGGTTLTRSFDELAFLVPGVAPPPQAIGNTVGPGVGGGVGTSGQFSVNGLRSRANNFTVDGSDNNDEDIGVRRQGFFALVPQPIESIQEYQITTLLAPAEFGRNLGAQVNALSKSGGNRFSGTIYGFGNADFLNARNFFDNAAGDSTRILQAQQTFANGNQRLVDVCLNAPLTATACPDANRIRVTNNAGEKDTFSLLQGGFAVGGRIIRNKLFFFTSGEYQHLDGVRERHFAVPTVEQRGIFGTGATGFFGAAPNNEVVPLFPSAFRSEAVYSLFPFPNDPNGVYGANTYTKALSIDARGVILSGKLDYNFFEDTERPQTLTARYNFTDDKRDLTDVGGALFSAIRPLVRTDNFSTYLTGGLTNNLSNEFRFSWGRTRLEFEELRDDFLLPIRSLNSSQDTRFLLNARYFSNNTIARCPAGRFSCQRTELFFPSFVNIVNTGFTTENSDLGPVGQIIIGGFSPVGVDVFNFPQERENNTFQFADTMRWQFSAGGQHSLAFGADIRRTYLESDLPRNSRPLLTFFGAVGANRSFTSPVTLAASGAATGFFQSLVLPNRDARINLSYNQLNFFAQDEWRAANNLTFNFGVRYELNTTPKEADRKIEDTFQASLPSFLRDLSRFIDGRTKIYDTDYNNFAPRFGFAYAPNSDTVIRGGFGMYYDQILGAVVSQSRNVFPTFMTVNFGGGDLEFNQYQQGRRFTLFNPRDALLNLQNNLLYSCADLGNCDNPSAQFIRVIAPNTLNMINPALTNAQLQTVLSEIFLLFPFRCQPGATTCSGPYGTTLPTRDLNTPFSYQYSIGIERRLFGDTFLSAAYVGTNGRDLLRFTTPNLGNNYIADVVGVFYDSELCAPGGDIGNCEAFILGSTLDPRRPVATVGPINQFETTGRSRYHSLQLELRGRLDDRFQYRANYVFGRVKDDVSDVFDLAGAFALPQNSRTFEGEYAPANFDVRHRFTYNFIFDTPEMRDQNGAVRFLLGGWQIAGAGRFNTGQPFTVNSIFDVNQDGNLTDRLDNLRFITETGRGSQPLTVQAGADLTQMLAALGRDGSVPRNSFRAGKLLELDLAFAKRFVFKETQSILFRVDVFNFINRANFAIPVRFLEAPGFGRATDTVTPGRRIQIGLKYMF